MRWVTYYYSVKYGVFDLTIHKDKETATRFFKRNYSRYFDLCGRALVKLPMSYGFMHRNFVGQTIVAFKKRFGKSAEAAIKRAEKKESKK